MPVIKNVTIVGANGSMGALCAGILAGFGSVNIFMVARSTKKAKEGIQKACSSIKSGSIINKLIPKTFHDLKECVQASDWVFETVGENMLLKTEVNKKINAYSSTKTIVTTVSSGLSITKLSECFDKEKQQNYFGTHFFNPPYKMTLCEVVLHKQSNKKVAKTLIDFLHYELQRHVVVVHDTPGFAGNRIGFQLLNEVAQYAEKYQERGGIAYMDALLCGVTGRTLPPLSTIDMVGLDIHYAIVDNIFINSKDSAHATFKLPQYIRDLIQKNYLGNKTSGGFYKKVGNIKHVYNIKKKTYEPIPSFQIECVEKAKELIVEGYYNDAIETLCTSKGIDSRIIGYFFARYISYAYSLIGTTVARREEIDKVMGYGFNWLPPSALVDLLGGVKKTIQLIAKYKLPVPHELTKNINCNHFYTLQKILDYRSFLKAI